MRAVGVRELRQNLSVYLRRVVAGETLTVTDRGSPVAVLAPLGVERDPIAEGIAAGRIRPATSDVREFLRQAVPDPGPGTMPISEALAEQRRERDR
jgi:prevent-host-death family protein